MTAGSTGSILEIVAADVGTAARVGVFRTAHGIVDTPGFMPVATQATVKGVTPAQLREAGGQIFVSNTYHLWVRPGIDLVERMGGLHAFMGWDRTILTDSGGYQVFSLARLSKVDDAGVRFQSHLDGAPIHLTPESVVDAQQRLGSDVLMPLDQPLKLPASRDALREALDRTHLWARRSVEAWTRRDLHLFGIVQGGDDAALRRESAEVLRGLDLPGYAIGGLSVGEGTERMLAAVEATAPHLPTEKPRYLMGVGHPDEILHAVARGIDLFDCILPTRLARHGWVYTRAGMLKVKHAAWREDRRPLEPGCPCPACASFTRAYLRHLFLAGETLGGTMLTLHNLWFYLRLLADARSALRAGTFGAFFRDVAPPLRTVLR